MSFPFEGAIIVNGGSITLNTDSRGISFYGPRIYKQSGDGMYIIPHNDGNTGDGVGGIKFRCL
jgi:hypothetical protein